MEANVMMTYEQDETEGPYTHVLPRKPTEAYKRMADSTLQAIKKTERIAFPDLRELVLMYLLPN